MTFFDLGFFFCESVGVESDPSSSIRGGDTRAGEVLVTSRVRIESVRSSREWMMPSLSRER